MPSIAMTGKDRFTFFMGMTYGEWEK